MPTRKLTLLDGTVITRTIINIHPDGVEFLPEKTSIPADGERGSRIYDMLAEVIRNIAANKE